MVLQYFCKGINQKLKKLNILLHAIIVNFRVVSMMVFQKKYMACWLIAVKWRKAQHDDMMY